MRRRDLLAFAAGIPLRTAAAQQAMLVIGWLSPLRSDRLLPQRDIVAFRQGLAEAGFVEGQNVRLEYRRTEGDAERLPASAAELAARKVDVIATQGGDVAAVAAKHATSTIPIVFNSFDPVAAGLIASLARPGGNLAGVGMMTPELNPKLLELLLELVPRAETVALLVNPQSSATKRVVPLMQEAACVKAVPLQVLSAAAIADLDTTFAEIDRLRPGGLIVDLAFGRHIDAPLALSHRLPAIAMWRDFRVAGGLASYGPSLAAAYRLKEVYAGRILKGEKPAELPVAAARSGQTRVNGAMRRREVLGVVAGVAAWRTRAGLAQQSGKRRRLGILLAVADSDPDVRAGLNVFTDTLRQLGWEQGHNLEIEYRWGFARADQIAGLAKELVQLSPDILVAHSTPPTAALRRETQSIPIVFLTVTDPLGQGLVSSLARPGGNVTGFSVFESSLGAKWLQLLTEIAPGIRRAYIVFNPITAPYYNLYLKVIAERATLLKIETTAAQAHDEEELARVIGQAGEQPGTGLFVLPDSFNIVHRNLIIRLAAEYRLPAVYYFRYFAKDGGLITYGPDELDLFRRTAGYVDRILRGADPGALPVQVPSKWEMAINLQTAKELDLIVPQLLLQQADEGIE